MTVLGIGGLFFRANDPDLLNAWYRDHLGVGAGCSADPDSSASAPADAWSWTTLGGPTIFAPFKAATDYWPADKQWMLNLRVTDLDGLTGRLTIAGIEVTTDPAADSPETGRFVRIHDPEGNAIELWQPPA